jgi:hypothetical protein
MKKKIMIVILLGAILFQGFAQSEDDYEYVVNGQSVTITAYTGNIKTVRIPAKLGGLQVTVTGKNAFKDIELLGAIIPAGVVEIEEGAFSKNKIATLNLPAGLLKIGKKAFSQANYFDNGTIKFTIPDSVTEIGEEAFSFCAFVGELKLPANLAKLGKEAFHGNGISSVIFPAKFSVIPEGAFSSNAIKKLIIPATVKEIEDNAFSRNPLEELTLAEGIVKIGNSAFAGPARGFSNVYKGALTSITIPASVKEFGENVFEGHPLALIIIGDNLDLQHTSISNDDYKEVQNDETNNMYARAGFTIKGSSGPAIPPSFYKAYYLENLRKGGTYRLVEKKWVKDES